MNSLHDVHGRPIVPWRDINAWPDPKDWDHAHALFLELHRALLVLQSRGVRLAAVDGANLAAMFLAVARDAYGFNLDDLKKRVDHVAQTMLPQEIAAMKAALERDTAERAKALAECRCGKPNCPNSPRT